MGSSGRKSAQEAECELSRVHGSQFVLIMMKTLRTNATQIQPKSSEITSPIKILHVLQTKS